MEGLDPSMRPSRLAAGDRATKATSNLTRTVEEMDSDVDVMPGDKHRRTLAAATTAAVSHRRHRDPDTRLAGFPVVSGQHTATPQAALRSHKSGFGTRQQLSSKVCL